MTPLALAGLTANQQSTDARTKKALASFLFILKRDPRTGESPLTNPVVDLAKTHGFVSLPEHFELAQRILATEGVEGLEERVEAFKAKRLALSVGRRRARSDKERRERAVPGTLDTSPAPGSPPLSLSQGRERPLGETPLLAGQSESEAGRAAKAGSPRFVPSGRDRDSVFVQGQRAIDKFVEESVFGGTLQADVLAMVAKLPLETLEKFRRANTVDLRTATRDEQRNALLQLVSGALDAGVFDVTVARVLDGKIAKASIGEVTDAVAAVQKAPAPPKGTKTKPTGGALEELTKRTRQDDLGKAIPESEGGIKIPKGDERDFYEPAFSGEKPLLAPRLRAVDDLERIVEPVSTRLSDILRGAKGKVALRAEDVLAEAKKLESQASQSVGAGFGAFDPRRLAALAKYAEYGALKAVEFGTDRAAWAAHMAEKAGDWIKPHLDAMWESFQKDDPDLEFGSYMARLTDEGPTLKLEPGQPKFTSGRDVDVLADASLVEDPETFALLESALEKGAPRPDANLLKVAKAIMSRATQTADAVIVSRRAMSTEEVLANTLRRAQIKKEHKELTVLAAQAFDRGDMGTFSEIKAEVQGLESAFHALSQANRISGAEQGAAFRARQLAIGDDFSYLGQIERYKVQHGKAPTAKTLTDIRRITTEREGLIDKTPDESFAQSVEQAEETLRKARSRKGPKEKGEVSLDFLLTKLNRLRKERSETVTPAIANEFPDYALDKNVNLPEEEGLILNKYVSSLQDKDKIDDLATLVQRVHENTGRVYSDQQILDAFTGRGYNFASKDAPKTLELLKTEARLRSKIADALDGAFDPKGAPRDWGTTIIALRKELAALRRRKTLSGDIAEARRMARIERLLDETVKQIERGSFKPRRVKSPAEQSLLDQLREAQDYLRSQEKIADLEQSIRKARRGEYTPLPKKAKSDRLRENERRIRQLENDLTVLTTDKSGLELFTDALQSQGATADNSGVGRHAINQLFNNPASFFNRAGQSTRAMFDRAYYESLRHRIVSAPGQALREASGLRLPLDEVTRQEDFRGTLTELVTKKFPWLYNKVTAPLFDGMKVVTDAAERAINIMNGGVRADWFDALVAANPGAGPERLREFARTANAMTGRADLADGAKFLGMDVSKIDPWFDNQAMRLGMWSPRFAASKPQTYALMFSKDKAVRAQAVRVLTSKAAATIGFLETVDYALEDWDFNVTDPSDPGWLKLVNNKTGVEFDVWGGDLPLVRVLVRNAVSPFAQAGLTSKDESKGLQNDLARWAENKAGPGIQLLQAISGKDFMGNDLAPKGDILGQIGARVRGIGELFLPLAYRDLASVWRADAAAAPGAGMLGFYGVGVDVREKQGGSNTLPDGSKIIDTSALENIGK